MANSTRVALGLKTMFVRPAPCGPVDEGMRVMERLKCRAVERERKRERERERERKKERKKERERKRRERKKERREGKVKSILLRTQAQDKPEANN